MNKFTHAVWNSQLSGFQKDVQNEINNQRRSERRSDGTRPMASGANHRIPRTEPALSHGRLNQSKEINSPRTQRSLWSECRSAHWLSFFFFRAIAEESRHVHLCLERQLECIWSQVLQDIFSVNKQTNHRIIPNGRERIVTKR